LSSEDIKIIAVNRKARFDYTVDETIECGMVLAGTEVKSIRLGKISFPDAYASIDKGELWMHNLTIAAYDFASVFNHDPGQPRKLLVHGHELKRLARRVDEKGFTLIPLDFHFRNGRVKVELGICKGKRQSDKRDAIKERDVKRDLQREFKDHRT